MNLNKSQLIWQPIFDSSDVLDVFLQSIVKL